TWTRVKCLNCWEEGLLQSISLQGTVNPSAEVEVLTWAGEQRSKMDGETRGVNVSLGTVVDPNEGGVFGPERWCLDFGTSKSMTNDATNTQISKPCCDGRC
ncbi:unnamed protein product, partial [Choristocarpus tenellus]